MKRWRGWIPILVCFVLVDTLTSIVAVLSLHEVLDRMELEVAMTETEGVRETLEVGVEDLEKGIGEEEDGGT